MTPTVEVPDTGAGPEATRAKIVLAARDAFQAEGFDQASTRAIAAAAGVNSSLLFRYFGSKSGLYEVAVMAPLQGFIDDYVRRWSEYQGGPHTAERVAAEYLGGLYDLFRGHRELVLALVGGGRRSGLDSATHTAEQAQIADWVARLLDGVQVVVDTEAERRGWSGYSAEPGDGGRMSLRMALGLAFSMAVLEDWMFGPDDRRPTRDQIVGAMVSYVLRSMSNPGGVYGVPDAYETSGEGRSTDAGVPPAE